MFFYMKEILGKNIAFYISTLKGYTDNSAFCSVVYKRCMQDREITANL